VCVCVYVSFCVGALERRKRVSNQSPVPLFPGSFVGAPISYLVGVVRRNPAVPCPLEANGSRLAVNLNPG